MGALKGSLGQKVYLDANFFIYALEALEPWAGPAGRLIAALDRGECSKAARLRALTRIKLPDAIHGATALQRSCSSFLTNDDRLTIPGIEMLRWSDLEAALA